MSRVWLRVGPILLCVGALGACCPEPSQQELPVVDLEPGPNFPLESHLESAEIADGGMSFEELFEAGGDLFHASFNGDDGVGALRLPNGTPFPRFHPAPAGGGFGGPISSQRCGACHLHAASGEANSNILSDPDNDGQPPFNVRTTISLFGNGLLQLLAVEMTEELQAIRDTAGQAAMATPGQPVEKALVAKGIDFGVIAATVDAEGHVAYDVSRRQGIDPDLVVRPLGWKGNVTTVRSNTVGAANFLMGMQADEFVWKLEAMGVPGPDTDGDGVERELSVGDITAMVVYGAAQETPESVELLASQGWVQAPSAEDIATIARGRGSFDAAGCAGCHVPELHLSNTVFEEPTARAGGAYLDHFLAGKDAHYDPQRPVRFDLLTQGDEPRVEAHPDGGAVVRLFGDLKRHDMGRQLADPAGPQPPITANFAPLEFDGQIVLIPTTQFLTPELWGTGNTGPWLHDGRAATLREAILFHGEDEPPAVGDPLRSEAQEARDAFVALGAADQKALVTFLRSLHSFSQPPRP
jgi:mono/diheme cytochrome c family protein